MTYINSHLLAAEAQVRTREILCDLCSMHTTIISDPSEVKGCAVFCDRPALHGRCIQFLDIQFLSACYPSYRTGIPYENLELIELIFKLSFRQEMGSVSLLQSPCNIQQPNLL